MDWNADFSWFGEVSVGKVSMVLSGDVLRRLERTEERLSGLRARRATARLPCFG